jgi:O-antigen ligase
VSVAEPQTASGRADQDRVAYRALLAFTFVLLLRPQDHLALLEWLHLAELTGLFAVIALVTGRLAHGRPVTRMPLALGAVLTFAGLMLATAPFSVWPGGAVSVFTDLFSKVVVVFALMVNTLTTRARFERFVYVVVLGTSYVALRAVIDYARGANLVEGGRVVGAVSGLFGNPNDMALNMVAFMPLAIVLALTGRRPLFRAFAALGVPAMAAAVVFSQSRGGTLALVAMLAALLYQVRRVRPAVAVLVVAASLAALPMLPASFTERMSTIFNPAGDPTGSREARKRLLRDGYQAFLAHPIFGLGAGNFTNYNPPGREEVWRENHNALLQVASELGIGGVVVFAVIVGSGFAAAIRAGTTLRRARPRRRIQAPDQSRLRQPLELYAAALVASFTGWVVAAMFASVAYYWTLYLVLGLAVTLRDITLDEVGGAAPARRAHARVGRRAA